MKEPQAAVACVAEQAAHCAGGVVPVYTSMLDAAVRHGVTLGQWADAEAGRVDPAPLIARVLEGQ